MTQFEDSLAGSWQRREKLAGTIDFTMMYVAHDAFGRDLGRLQAAARDGRGLTPEAVATWRGFSKQLHTHHTAEDAALWPALHRATNNVDEVAILTDMESEHAALDPRIDRVDAAIAHRDTAVLREELAALGSGLAQHMRHEEEAALPLLERRLGAPGWTAFTENVRERVGGLKAAAEYLPWLLDGAAKQTRDKVLGLLPPPARLIYRGVWQPRYRKSGRLA
jgi:Hemerythrin HHE cation binding domain